MNQDAFYSQSDQTIDKKHTGRIWYADVIRITAIIMVVLIHVASKDFHRVDVASFHWQFMNALNGLARVSVPLLFMVSGMFFLDPDKEIQPQTIFTKNIWRIARAFIFWSAVYLLYRNFNQPPQPLPDLQNLDVSPEVVEETAWDFIRGNFHLWFLYRLAEVYAIVPILRPLTKKKWLVLYFIAVSVIVGFLMPTYRQFPIKSTDTLADNGINFDITLGYAGYMMLGYFLHQYDLPKKVKRLLYGLGIIGAGVTIAATSYLSLQEGQLFARYYEYLTPNVLTASVAFFVFMKDRFASRTWSPRAQKILLQLSTYSFGIYLIHVLVRDLLWDAGWNTTLLHPLISVPLSVLIVGGISYALIAVLSRSKWMKKVIS